MADAQGLLSKIAQGLSDAWKNRETPDRCPTCGKPKDDVPGPNKKDAAAFQKGFGQSDDSN